MSRRPANRTTDLPVVRALATATFLQWLGASAVLPLLPQYLRHRGASDAAVGAVMAAFFAAGVLLQFPAGRVADSVGRRPVLVAGLGCYAVASAGFLMDPSPAADIALRALQGAGAGAAEVASLAMVSESVPLGSRGRAFGTIYAGQLGGLALGPFIGSLVGVRHMAVLFVTAAVAAVAACLPILVGTAAPSASARPSGPAGGHRSARGETGRVARQRVRLNRSLAGSLVTAAALGLTFGVYESCWTLLLVSRGARNWQIGLSWTMFAAPFVAMARPGGWLADHFDRRRLVMGALASSIGFCTIYPFIRSVGVLVGLGTIEAVGVAIALPSAQSLLSQSSDPTELGRVQGLFSTSQTASVALAAVVGGSLFAAARWAPFVAAAAGATVLAAMLPFVWAPVAGRVPGAAAAGAGGGAGGGTGGGVAGDTVVGTVTGAAASPGDGR